MASIDYKLASQRLNPGAATRGLSPVTFSGQTGGKVGAPQIGIHSADVNFVPAPIPPITIDTTLQSAASFANVFTQAAFKFQEQEAQAQADQRVLLAQEKFAEVFNSYASTDGEQATTGHSTFAQEVSKLAGESLNDLSPSAKSKAVNRIQQLRNTALNQGAVHKAKQFKVWQGQIMEAQETQAINDIVVSAGNPKAVMTKLQTLQNSVAVQYAGQNDLTILKQQSITDKTFMALASSLIDQNKFREAQDYLELGKVVKADPVKITKAEQAIKSALASKVSSDLSLESKMAARAKRLEQEYSNVVLNAAVKNSTPEALLAIPNIKLREEMSAIYDKAQSDRPTTPEGLAFLASQQATLADNPDLALDMSLWEGRGVAAKDLIAARTQAINDRKLGITEVRKEAKAWINSMMIPTTVGPYGKLLFDAKAMGSQRRMTEMFDSAIDYAVRNNESVSMTIYDVKSKILNDPNFRENFSAVETTRQSLTDISGITNMFSLETEIAPYMSPDERGALVKKRYKESVVSLFNKYKLPTDLKTQADLVKHFRNDANGLRAFLSDSNELDLQRVHYENLTPKKGAESIGSIE
jgi:hypothetical protein